MKPALVLSIAWTTSSGSDFTSQTVIRKRGCRRGSGRSRQERVTPAPDEPHGRRHPRECCGAHHDGEGRARLHAEPPTNAPASPRTWRVPLRERVILSRYQRFWTGDWGWSELG